VSPRVSAIVCTLNRASTLGAALESLTSQTYAPDDFEIVVVDNGSTDDTRDVAAAAQRNARVRVAYIHEPVRGLSTARNRARRESRGEVLAYLDDDARAEPDWLAATMRAFDAHPDADAIGGRVLPDAGFEYPSWLPARLQRHLSHVDHGPRERWLTYPHYPFGTNLALRRSVFERVGEFDTDLGRIGEHSVRTGEETELLLRLERVGGRILYVPTATVRHAVESQRLSPSWIYRQTFSIGHSGAVMDRKSGAVGRCMVQSAMAPIQISAGLVSGALARVVGHRRLQVLADSVVRNRCGYLLGMSGKAVALSAPVS
jgi:glycosyltransferase involved in cell wall biosynthesis